MDIEAPVEPQALATGTKPGTRTGRLRAAIADEIVRGTLRPGTPLEEVEIARRHGVSRTPVREALRDLAASGLVETRSHRSALVATPSLEQLRGMFEVMGELEALCAAACATGMSPDGRRGLETLHRELSRAMRDGDPQRYHEGNTRFHDAIYDGAGNPYLAEITRATRDRLAPFRRAQFRNLGRIGMSHAEHQRIVTAILQGDRDGAVREMRAHIATVEFAYERYAQNV